MHQNFTSLAALFFLLTLLPASYAHAAVSPPLGVQGTPKRSDVKRPTKGNPCGAGVNIASALDTSTAVLAAANGEVKVTAINFNAGADGSRKVSAKVDPSGTGKTFVDMVVTVNGDPTPKENSAPQEVVAQLPANTKCTGGAKKDRCLVQFVTTRGFGNCVAVSQGAASDSVSNPPTSKAAPAVVAAKKTEAVRAVKKEDKPETADGKAAAKKKTKKAKKAKKGENKKKADKKKKGVKSNVAVAKKAKAEESGKKEAAKEKKADKKKKGNKKKGEKKNKKDGKKKKGNKSGDKAEAEKKVKRQAGTRAARALLSDLDDDLREWKTKIASTN